MNKLITVLKYSQEMLNQKKQEYYLAVLKLEIIEDITTVLIYGKDDYGYQREVNIQHIKKIKKSILEGELVSPTAVILGINKSVLEKYLSNGKLNLENIRENEKLRIIDGQHRIKALTEVFKTEPHRFENYELGVIIMVIDDNNRKIEVKTFTDINSKSKPIKLDLAMLATYNYDLLEGNEDLNISIHIGAKIADFLNKSNSVWKNAIILDINSAEKIGIVGFKTFYESISQLTKFYEERVKQNTCFIGKKQLIDEKSKEICEQLLLPCWEIVRMKWNKCFEKTFIYYGNEELEIMYDKNYYLQTTLGCKVINGIIVELFTAEQNFETVIVKFEDLVLGNRFKDKDWAKGETFSGMSSESGVKKIKDMITKKSEL
ncbi:DGQHR domain-containing protein [uncultured Fusobacterium sp.]|uniref:DGQHR domain-containing protein n=1 Tax=uncultured Fusobacterium sp. TaxID=159267 RepID=UPI0025E6D6B5|nr:DGQHR domain-containing protein [uncultured Fusobacterium sp.]